MTHCLSPSVNPPLDERASSRVGSVTIQLLLWTLRTHKQTGLTVAQQELVN